MTTRRPEPIRTCVGCRLTGGKRELLRLVRGPGGKPTLDPTGKAPGRGTYLHRDPGCWRTALSRGSISRALRTTLTAEEAGTLLEAIKGVSKK